ncbi:unnamed protein product [Paramecium sonneborni]|uniref:Uncharacterized protein n=1 Tax=Paramecium sonneborni TaxID=65129 RepID=A0A8S1QE49_9CILI|nr:unnamed protein product [Paramecium sonneborni]
MLLKRCKLFKNFLVSSSSILLLEIVKHPLPEFKRTNTTNQIDCYLLIVQTLAFKHLQAIITQNIIITFQGDSNNKLKGALQPSMTIISKIFKLQDVHDITI